MCDYHLEMLSLSQDQQNPASIQFDDLTWQCHLPSLKPLGLNIMLNLCNASVTQQLCRFSDHLSNLALQESHGTVLPVYVPWGLCELSRLIGRRAETILTLGLNIKIKNKVVMSITAKLSLLCACLRVHTRCEGAVQTGEPPGALSAAHWRENKGVDISSPSLLHQTPASTLTPHLPLRTRLLLQYVNIELFFIEM